MGSRKENEGWVVGYRGDSRLKMKQLNKKRWLVTKEGRVVRDKESMFCKLSRDFLGRKIFFFFSEKNGRKLESELVRSLRKKLEEEWNWSREATERKRKSFSREGSSKTSNFLLEEGLPGLTNIAPFFFLFHFHKLFIYLWASTCCFSMDRKSPLFVLVEFILPCAYSVFGVLFPFFVQDWCMSLFLKLDIWNPCLFSLLISLVLSLWASPVMGLRIIMCFMFLCLLNPHHSTTLLAHPSNPPSTYFHHFPMCMRSKMHGHPHLIILLTDIPVTTLLSLYIHISTCHPPLQAPHPHHTHFHWP